MSQEKFILPPEWAQQDAVLMAWPHAATDWNYILNDIQNCFVEIAKAIIKHERLIIVAPDIDEPMQRLSTLPESHRISYFAAPTNDTWARDFGAISVANAAGEISPLDYRFNAWGLKFAACHDNLINAALAKSGLFRNALISKKDFVLEGGSIEADGNGTILTTSECLLSPNRNPHLTQAQIEQRLKSDFGAEKVLWLDFGYLAGDDTDSHIDTLARFAPNNTIVYVQCTDPNDEHFTQLSKMQSQLESFTNAKGEPYTLIPLPMPDAIIDPDDEIRLPATYANFLIVNGAVLVPTYNQPQNDDLALQQIAKAFPNHDIVGIDCQPVIRQHGSLHCLTMQLPANSLRNE